MLGASPYHAYGRLDDNCLKLPLVIHAGASVYNAGLYIHDIYTLSQIIFGHIFLDIIQYFKYLSVQTMFI